jgi:transposase
VKEIEELRRQGLSISAISAITGNDRKTIRKYLADSGTMPRYGPREPRPGKLDGFKAYIEDRLNTGVWNAVVLLRELRERGYQGGYTLLTDYLKPLRRSARMAAVRRFETPPGHQAQVDWGHLGSVVGPDGAESRLWAFVFTLGHSRAMMADVAVDQKLATLLRMHEAAFQQLGGVPAEILYDRMKTVVLGSDERGEVRWHPVFRDFADYWGFTPRLCRPYRAPTKGKVESGIRYMRASFLCGRQASNGQDLPNQLRAWVWEEANQRVHGTTHEVGANRWESELAHLQATGSRPPFPLLTQEPRRVSRDAYVAWQASRYSVPWRYAGCEVWLPDINGRLEIRHGEQIIATHPVASGPYQTLCSREHHADIPLRDAPELAHDRLRLRVDLPEVEVRPLSVYDDLALGGAQ